MRDSAALSRKSSKSYEIHTSLVFDSKEKEFLQNISFTVSRKTGMITGVRDRSNDTSPLQLGEDDLDLRGYTVVPGLVDAHTHIFLHSYREASSIYQERDESLPERILRAGNHLKLALKAGYTTYRDLGTEGLGSHDVGVRDAVNRGIVPGPRLFVATEALASEGGYEIRIEGRGQGTSTARLSDPCNGVEGVTAGVRRRLGVGADLIKFYADYRRRELRYPREAYPGGRPVQHPPGEAEEDDEEDSPINLNFESNPASPLFNPSEMKAIVAEARRAKCPVAAHAIQPETVIEACQAGVTTVEHAYIRSKDAIQAMKENNTIYIPTLMIVEDEGPSALPQALKQVKDAFDAGVTLACGGDTGAVGHGESAREIELFVKAGIPLVDSLQAATLGGFGACGGDWCGRRFGWLGKGWAADMVALKGDMRESGISCIRNVELVIKDGRIMVDHGIVQE